MSSDLTKRHTETGGAKASQANTGSAGGGGQKVSSERGTATRSKKNPGKRPSQGGNSR